MTKKIREQVYRKFDGHCAYCGKPIELKDMQVDHFIPQRLTSFKIDERLVDGPDDINNLFPSCRRCNHYKRANSLETFRKQIETIPQKLYAGNYIFKVACDYKFFSPNNRKIIFYFEKEEWREKGLMFDTLKLTKLYDAIIAINSIQLSPGVIGKVSSILVEHVINTDEFNNQFTTITADEYRQICDCLDEALYIHGNENYISEKDYKLMKRILELHLEVESDDTV